MQSIAAWSGGRARSVLRRSAAVRLRRRATVRAFAPSTGGVFSARRGSKFVAGLSDEAAAPDGGDDQDDAERSAHLSKLIRSREPHSSTAAARSLPEPRRERSLIQTSL